MITETQIGWGDTGITGLGDQFPSTSAFVSHDEFRGAAERSDSGEAYSKSARGLKR
jgi:hypothetical protein